MITKFFEYLTLTLGSVIVAAGLELILAPNGLIDGGITGISIMIASTWEPPLWLIYLSFNLPILVFTAKDVGRKFAVRTLYANIVTSAFLVILKPFPAITSSDVLIVLYGGLLLGLGIGLVVKLGGAIDGTEMLAIWFNRHYHVPISMFLLGINAIILLGAALVFGLEKAMFSVAIFYLVTKMIDFVLDGFNQGKSIMIISEKPDEVGSVLIADFDVKITYLYGEGGYLGETKKIIYCITNRFLYPSLRQAVLTIDKEAILEASYVSEVRGVRYPFSLHRH